MPNTTPKSPNKQVHVAGWVATCSYMQLRANAFARTHAADFKLPVRYPAPILTCKPLAIPCWCSEKHERLSGAMGAWC